MSNTKNTFPIPECNDAMYDMLMRLRSAQKAYFSAPGGSAEKLKLLEAAKSAEYDLDQFLKARKAALTNPTLF